MTAYRSRILSHVLNRAAEMAGKSSEIGVYWLDSQRGWITGTPDDIREPEIELDFRVSANAGAVPAHPAAREILRDLYRPSKKYDFEYGTVH